MVEYLYVIFLRPVARMNSPPPEEFDAFGMVLWT